MVALFRIVKREPSDSGGAGAGVLLGLALLLMLAPGGLFLFPPPWNTVCVYGQTVLWIVTLIFLHRRAPTERSGALRRPPGSSLPASAAPAPQP
jgi:hypothetical protein